MYKNELEASDPNWKLLADMVKYFGKENFPNPTHEPIRFAWFCKLYAYNMQKTEGKTITFPAK
jgi:hypothetical protein